MPTVLALGLDPEYIEFPNSPELTPAMVSAFIDTQLDRLRSLGYVVQSCLVDLVGKRVRFFRCRRFVPLITLAAVSVIAAGCDSSNRSARHSEPQTAVRDATKIAAGVLAADQEYAAAWLSGDWTARRRSSRQTTMACPLTWSLITQDWKSSFQKSGHLPMKRRHGTCES